MSFSKKDVKVKKYFQHSKILHKIDTKTYVLNMAANAWKKYMYGFS